MCVDHLYISILFDIVKSEWSVVHIEGSHVIISIINAFPSAKIDFVLANSADPDEIPRQVAYLVLHCLQKYPFRGLQFPRLP